MLLLNVPLHAAGPHWRPLLDVVDVLQLNGLIEHGRT